MSKRRVFSFRHWLEERQLLGTDKEATMVAMRLPEGAHKPAELEKLFMSIEDGKLYRPFMRLWGSYVWGLQAEARYIMAVTKAMNRENAEAELESGRPIGRDRKIEQEQNMVSFRDYAICMVCDDLAADQIRPYFTELLDKLPQEYVAVLAELWQSYQHFQNGRQKLDRLPLRTDEELMLL